MSFVSSGHSDYSLAGGRTRQQGCRDSRQKEVWDPGGGASRRGGFHLESRWWPSCWHGLGRGGGAGSGLGAFTERRRLRGRVQRCHCCPHPSTPMLCPSLDYGHPWPLRSGHAQLAQRPLWAQGEPARHLSTAHPTRLQVPSGRRWRGPSTMKPCPLLSPTPGPKLL